MYSGYKTKIGLPKQILKTNDIDISKNQITQIKILARNGSRQAINTKKIITILAKSSLLGEIFIDKTLQKLKLVKQIYP